MPAVCSQDRDQVRRSRPDARSRQPSRSSSSVLPKACRAKYVAAAGEELRRPDVGHELLEHRRALGVGDAVEVLPRRLQVVDPRHDRVRGGQLVLVVGPRLAPAGERGPGAVELGRRLADVVAHEVGERLLQPGAVPPPRGHQVAEPHVRHLVQDHLGPPGPLRARGRTAVHVPLAEGDQPRVLHRAEVVLRHEDRVVLAPRVGVVERLVEEVQALPGDSEDRVGSKCWAIEARHSAPSATSCAEPSSRTRVQTPRPGGRARRRPR